MKCKRIVYHNLDGSLLGLTSPKVLLGRVISEDDNFVCFLTGRGRTYRIAKNTIVAIEDTSDDFIFEKVTNE